MDYSPESNGRPTRPEGKRGWCAVPVGFRGAVGWASPPSVEIGVCASYSSPRKGVAFVAMRESNVHPHRACVVEEEDAGKTSAAAEGEHPCDEVEGGTARELEQTHDGFSSALGLALAERAASAAVAPTAAPAAAATPSCGQPPERVVESGS